MHIYFFYLNPQGSGAKFGGGGGLSRGGFTGGSAGLSGNVSLSGSSNRASNPTGAPASLTEDQMDENLIRVKAEQKKRRKKNIPITLEQKFFMGGMFTEQDRKDFQRLRIIVPLVLAPVFGIVMFIYLGVDWLFVGAVLGVLLGFQVPYSILDRKIAARNEDMLFFLPLVIEQIAIGVSSSLDIGPCVQRVVLMADERDSHNVVTELFKIVNNYVRSGASLEDALGEVGELSGNTELRHTFASLAQVARHGGEVTRQLQELADAVASQRETKIEAKIKKLELAATGPVAMVFMGFLVILLIGFGLQVLQAFGN